jgi:hypothetical protein
MYKDQTLVEGKTIVKGEVFVGLLVEALEQGVCCFVLEVGGFYPACQIVCS